MSINFVSNYAQENYPELKTPIERLQRYHLASNATFNEKINYVIFRIWNAIKAIFGNSEWQIAKKEITDFTFKKVDKFNEEIAGHNKEKGPVNKDYNVEPLNKEQIQDLIDAGFAVLSEGQLDKAKIQEIAKSHFISALSSEVGVSKEFLAVFIRATSSDEKVSEDEKKKYHPEVQKFGNFVQDFITKGGLFTEANSPLLAKTVQSVKSFFEELDKQGQIQKSTTDALIKTTDLVVEYIKRNKYFQDAFLLALIEGMNS